MSLRTQFGIVFLLMAALSTSAWASRTDVNNAFNEFYRRFRASPDKSLSTIRELQSEILDPALKAGAQAGSDLSASGPEQSAVPVAAPIMDSKDVPNEIDFPGRHHRTTKSAPLPLALPR